MSRPSLYDEDILLWSEQQAAALRRLGQTRRDLPNELDLENVMEEIESVGRSELAAVQSHIRMLLVHLIKLLAEPHSEAARHWRGEIAAFHADMRRRYAPSMRQRIDMDELWASAREQLLLAYEGTDQQQMVAGLPDASPIAVDDLISARIDSHALLDRLRASSAPQAPGT